MSTEESNYFQENCKVRTCLESR